MRVVISGYIGCRNAGDEAILAAIVTQLRSLAPGLEIWALSDNPVETHHLHGIQAVYRYNISEAVRLLRGASLFISGGGSLFQDVTSWRSPAYYAATVALARAFGVPVFFYAQGVGPLFSRWGRSLTRWAANRAAYITVRDTASGALLKEIGVTAPVEITADPVFALEPVWSARTGVVWEQLGVRDEPVVAFALRPWLGLEKYLSDVAAAVHRLENEDQIRVALLPMRSGQDAILAEKIASVARAGVVMKTEGLTPAELAGLFGRFSLVVGMRLHAIILASAQLVPTVAIEYDPKVRAAARMLPGVSLLGFNSLTFRALYDEITDVWGRRMNIAGQLAPEVEKLRQLAKETARKALMVGRW